MVYVNRANVVVILDMLVVYAINCHAMHAVLNMANAKMAHAFAHKAGMDAIAHYVSCFLHILFNLTEWGNISRLHAIALDLKRGHNEVIRSENTLSLAYFAKGKSEKKTICTRPKNDETTNFSHLRCVCSFVVNFPSNTCNFVCMRLKSTLYHLILCLLFWTFSK